MMQFNGGLTGITNMVNRRGIATWRVVLDFARPWALTATVLLFVTARFGMSQGIPPWEATLVSSISIALIVVGGFGLNDFFDRRMDSSVHPERVIPSGRVKPGVVLLTSLVCFAVAVALFSQQSTASLLIGILAIMILAVYSPSKNVSGILGNILMALITALVVVYAYTTTRPLALDWQMILLSTAVFIALMSQELVKDIEDMYKEAPFRTTLPLQIGYTAVYRISAGLAASAIPLLLGFFFVGGRVIAGILAILVSVWLLKALGRFVFAGPQAATTHVRVLKIAMSGFLVILAAVHV
jgi:4-hydroxybenzoate polyprenyltransferase